MFSVTGRALKIERTCWSLHPALDPTSLKLEGRAISLWPVHKMGTHTPTDVLTVTDENGANYVVALDRKTRRACYLEPKYSQQIQLRDKNFYIWTANNSNDIRQALRLIRSVHSKMPRNRGTFICLAEVKSGQKTGSYTQCKLLGAALLDSLDHCCPVERGVLASGLFGHDWRKRLLEGEIRRGDIVHRLGLVCGTRFAVREDCQGHGFGQLLASHASIIGACWRWPPADVIEVVRWMESPQLLSVLQGKSDFLTRAGFSATPSHHWNQGRSYDATWVPAHAPARKVPAWYYRRVTDLRRNDDVLRAALEAIP